MGGYYYRHAWGWGGGHDQHNEKKLLISRNRMLSEENHGLCFNTEQMAKRIRGRDEEAAHAGRAVGDGVPWSPALTGRGRQLLDQALGVGSLASG